MNANSYDQPGTTGGNREDLRNILTILEPEDTPYTSLARKGDSPHSTLVEVGADTLRSVRKTGTQEGSDANRANNKKTKQKRFGVHVQRVMDEYGVTDVQQAISRNGGNAFASDEYASGKAKTLREVKRDIEAACCSDNETNGGNDSDMTTRGLFTWISSTQGTVQPVPTDFLTPAGNILSGVGTTVPLFTEAQLNAILKSMQRVYGGKREYQCIAGDSVIETVDNFTRVNSSTTNVRYNVMQDADENEITLMVQIFESSFGKLNMLPTQFNKVDSAGVADPQTAYILNMELHEILFLDQLHAMDLIDEGGGPAGFVKAMFANICKNPKGAGKIYNT